jgi:hypothetical protein
MQALKSLVIGMGILIVIGLALLVYGLFQRASDPDFTFFGESGQAAPEIEAPGPSTAFGDIVVPLAPGCEVVDMRAEENRLLVRIGPAGSCARIVAIDMTSGKILGNVTFWEKP